MHHHCLGNDRVLYLGRGPDQREQRSASSTGCCSRQEQGRHTKVTKGTQRSIQRRSEYSIHQVLGSTYDTGTFNQGHQYVSDAASYQPHPEEPICLVEQIQVDACAMVTAGDFTYGEKPAMAELDKMARAVDKLSVIVNYWTFYYVFGGKDVDGLDKAKKNMFHQLQPQPISKLKKTMLQFLESQFEPGAKFDKENPKDPDPILPDACDQLRDEWQYYSIAKTMIPDAWKFQAFSKAIKKIKEKDTLPDFKKGGKDITDFAGVQTWLAEQAKHDKKNGATDWGVEAGTFSGIVQGFNYPKTVCNLLKRWIGGHFSGGREYDMAIFQTAGGGLEPVDNLAVLCDDGRCYPAKEIQFFQPLDKSIGQYSVSSSFLHRRLLRVGKHVNDLMCNMHTIAFVLAA